MSFGATGSDGKVRENFVEKRLPTMRWSLNAATLASRAGAGVYHLDRTVDPFEAVPPDAFFL